MISPWKSEFESDRYWSAKVNTPAFVLNEAVVIDSARRIQRIAQRSDSVLLYSVKACSLPWVIQLISRHVDGYSVSSLFEAQLARRLAPSHRLHFVSPALRPGEINALLSICERITLNSFGQLNLIAQANEKIPNLGIRLNPGTPFVTEPRYDPCRRNSKLGVPLKKLVQQLTCLKGKFSGLHIHSNCDSGDLGQLVESLQCIEATLVSSLWHCQWVNIGGGYTYEEEHNVAALCAELVRIKCKYNIELVMEPGAAFVRRAGCFVSTVVDVCRGDDYPIAILDLTVNHWPEVFEYQFEPDVIGHADRGEYTYILAGCSCLSGDLFGVYSFNEPLVVGSRVVFANAGAYSLVKAHMFNGINLPDIYALTEKGELALKKSFTYEDFASQWE
ncbi:MAG: hypothetical protein ACJ8FY_10000 [Gemmataceae bacterium]